MGKGEKNQNKNAKGKIQRKSTVSDYDPIPPFDSVDSDKIGKNVAKGRV